MLAGTPRELLLEPLMGLRREMGPFHGEEGSGVSAGSFRLTETVPTCDNARSMEQRRGIRNFSVIVIC